MKKSNQKQEVYSRLVDTELADYVTTNDIAFREAHLKTATKLSTLDFKSLPKTSKIKDFIGALVSDYQHLVDKTDSKIGGDLQKLKGQGHISDTQDQAQDIERQIETFDSKIVPLAGKFDDTGKLHRSGVIRWYRLFIPLLVIISSMELISNFDALDTLGSSRISSFGIAILCAICIYWYAHFSPEKIRKYGGGNVKKEIALFFLFLIPIVLVFYFFSIMRIQYLISLNPELSEVYNTNPLIFTLINAFAYTISCWIVWAFKPKREVILAYKKYKDDVKEIKSLETEREALKAQHSKLNSGLREKLTSNYQILMLGKQTEDEIVTRYEGCFEAFKLELYLKTNGACSYLFTGDVDIDLPKLKLNYQTINQTLQTS